MGVVNYLGTAEGELQINIAYSTIFLTYFFLGALSKSCNPYQSIIIITEFYNMAESNYHPRPPQYYYHPADTANFIPSNSQVRNHQDSFTPQHSRLSNVELTNTQFVPKIIESGYIVGPPIAYTQGPSLPSNFQAFSPSKSSLPVLLDSSQKHMYDYGNGNSKLVINQPSHIYAPVSQTKIQQPSIVIHSPAKQQTVPKWQYDRSVNECKNWQSKYNELYLRYNNMISGQQNDLQDQNRRLRQRVRQLEVRQQNQAGSSKHVKDLIERYKESTLKQCFLLLDRYRLECKQRQ